MRMRVLAAAVGGAVIGVTVLVAEDVPAMFSMKVDDAQGFVVSTMHGARPCGKGTKRRSGRRRAKRAWHWSRLF